MIIDEKARSDARLANLMSDLHLVQIETLAAIVRRIPGAQDVDFGAVANEVKARFNGPRTASVETLHREGVDDLIALVAGFAQVADGN